MEAKAGEHLWGETVNGIPLRNLQVWEACEVISIGLYDPEVSSDFS